MSTGKWLDYIRQYDTAIGWLTRLAPALMTALVDMAYNLLTSGPSHLINLGSPFLNSSNARDCFWNMARTASGDSHLSIMQASG